MILDVDYSVSSIDRELESLKPDGHGAPTDWESWYSFFFPDLFSYGFSAHHRDILEYGWNISQGEYCNPLLAILPRGGGKTTIVESVVTSCFARNTRKFALYVCGTQPSAQMRLQGVSDKITSPKFASYYPRVADRKMNAHGNPVGWRQDFIQTASGCVLVPVGLDKAAIRGLNVDSLRPDLILIDDVDGRHDTEQISLKKEEIIKDTILPTVGDSSAVVFVQNLIIDHGVVSRLVNGDSDMMVNRTTIGPIPAIEGLETKPVKEKDGRVRNRIVGGSPTWGGQDIEKCQRLIDEMTLSSFLREQQHCVKGVPGAMLHPDEVQHVAGIPRLDDNSPAFVRVAIGVDPPGGRTECGIVIEGDAGEGKFPRFYIWGDYTRPASDGPDKWGAEAVRAAVEKDGIIVAETNFGGNMVEFVVKTAAKRANEVVSVINRPAKQSKTSRAYPVVQSIQAGETVFVGHHAELEKELTTWIPSPGKSPNRIDALAHAHNANVLGRTGFYE